jgi:hypothetical protein
MVVDMESTPDPAEHVRAMQRAEAAPYVRMPPSPWWVPLVFGAWAAAYVGAFVFWRQNQAAFIVAMLLLVGGVCALLGWLTRRFGALPLPGRGTPPAEIRREYRRYGVGVVVVVGLVAGAWWWAGAPAAAGSAFASVTAGLALYQASYERAAASVRERLA